MHSQIIHSDFTFYQNANADIDKIKDNFIIRLNEFEVIIDDIRRNYKQTSVQHYLLLGRRGSGKSTLLKRIQVEIDSDKTLSQTHIAINLAEEQANIYKLFDLLEEIIQELEYKKVEIEHPAWGDDAHHYARSLFSAIHAGIEKSGKRVVLLLDNIDRIFENLQEDSGLLREYLLNYSDLKIIGGSTRMTEHFWKYNKPFYEFFRVIELKPLTSNEIKELLLNWSSRLKLKVLKDFVKTKPGQLETIRILTDGLPRTLQFFINILLTRAQETGYEYMRLIMDKVTPLYQERLNSLPPSQRKIVLQLAFLWESSGTKEIAHVTKMDNKVISAQLKQLSEKGIVERIETDTKNHLYRLSERFFNLWLIFTQGSPNEKRKAKCLTFFLENFYDSGELNNMAYEHLKAIEEKRISPDKAALLTKALAQSKYISFNTRDSLISKTLQLKEITEELKNQLPPTTSEIWTNIVKLLEKKDWEKAIKLTEFIEQIDGAKEFMLGYIFDEKGDNTKSEIYYLQAASKNLSLAFNNLGLLYQNLKKFDLAEEYFQKGIIIGDDKANGNLAFLYEELEKYDLAEKHYLLSLEKDQENSSILFNLAVLYWKQKKYVLAEKYYLLAIEKGNKDAFYNLALIYDNEGKFDLAEKYYLLSIEKTSTDAASLYNLALIYSNQKRYELAEKYYLLAIKEKHTGALNNLGSDYHTLKNYDEAEKYYLLASKENVTESFFNLGLLYEDLEKFDLSEKYYLIAIEKMDLDAYLSIALLYSKQSKFNLAENYFLLAIEKGITRAKYELALNYYTLKEKKEICLNLLTEYNNSISDEESLSLILAVRAWNGIFQNLEKDLAEIIKTENTFSGTTLVHLLIHHQKNIINNFFKSEEFGPSLKEKFLPIYFVTQLLSETGTIVSLKIPPELTETVADIMNEIKEEQLLYYQN